MGAHIHLAIYGGRATSSLSKRAALRGEWHSHGSHRPSDISRNNGETQAERQQRAGATHTELTRCPFMTGSLLGYVITTEKLLKG